MTISIDATRPSLTGNNTAKQSGRFSNALRSLALGTAIGLGSLAPTAATAEEKPPENVPVQIKEDETPAPVEAPKPDNPNNCGGRVALGYVAGVLMEKFLSSLRDKRTGYKA